MDQEQPFGIITADVGEVAAAWKGEKKFHAVFCDPPYGLGSVKDIRGLLEAWLADAEYDTGKGFMNAEWDVIPPPSVWRDIRENMVYPGAVLFAYGGTRTSDLLSLSIRLGGWEKFDEILHWSYGSGYPKVYDIGKAIDKAAGEVREIIGQGKGTSLKKRNELNEELGYRPGDYYEENDGSFDITAPASEDAKSWDGYGNLLKPAQEPILCFRAPYDGTYVDRALTYGTSALNIGGGRVSAKGETWEREPNTIKPNDSIGTFKTGVRSMVQNEGGRWPANLVLTHLPGCRPAGAKKVRATKQRVQKDTKTYESNSRAGDSTPPAGLATSGYADDDGLETVINWECMDGCPVKEMGEQSGILKSGKGSVKKASAAGYSPNAYGKENRPIGTKMVEHADEGTAARYFLQSHWAHEIHERIAMAPGAFYQAKVSKAERNAGVTGDGGTVNDGRKKEIDNAYQRGSTRKKNNHPTLKPIALNKWLATLLLPAESVGERRLLIPYSGAGSEAIGAMLAGWDAGLGLEGGKDYARISRERLEFWWNYYRHGGDDVRKILENWKPEPDDGPKQARMF